MLLGSVKERLGVTVRPVTPKEADAYGLDTDEGVAISSVDPKGPLGQAGFEVDDIILGDQRHFRRGGGRAGQLGEWAAP